MLDKTQSDVNLLEDEAARVEFSLLEDLRKVAAEFGIRVEKLLHPICLCFDDPHVVDQVYFPFVGWESPVRTWLVDKPEVMYVYSGARSGHPMQQNGERRRYRVCPRFINGKCSPLTLLARQVL